MAGWGDSSAGAGVALGVGRGLGSSDLRTAVGGAGFGATAAEPDRFDERDLRFLEAVAGWVGMLTQRAELAEELARQARRQGRREAGEEVARLTRRQQELAGCIAEGLSNREIAERLSLVPGTVANHVEHMLRRLDLKNRAQIGVWAVERGLYRSEREDDGR